MRERERAMVTRENATDKAAGAGEGVHTAAVMWHFVIAAVDGVMPLVCAMCHGFTSYACIAPALYVVTACAVKEAFTLQVCCSPSSVGDPQWDRYT